MFVENVLLDCPTGLLHPLVSLSNGDMHMGLFVSSKCQASGPGRCLVSKVFATQVWEPGFNLQDPVKSWAWWHLLVTWERRGRGMPRIGSVASLVESMSPRSQWETLSQQIRYKAPKVDLWPSHTGTHTCPYTYTYLCTHKHKQYVLFII